MKQVGVREAKLHFSRLLDEVARGESVTITRHGLPVAMLVPVVIRGQFQVMNAIEGLREFRTDRRLGNVSFHELIADGRR
jgi:prevent-host-death family protein